MGFFTIQADINTHVSHIYIAMFLNIHTIRVYGHVHYKNLNKSPIKYIFPTQTN